MQETIFLTLPRLHPQLASRSIPQGLPGPVFSLWPGLPTPPAGVWAPAYPWSAEQAAACLRDFAGSAEEGAKGTPVQALSLAGNISGLSPTEARALDEFRQLSASGAAAPSAPSAEGLPQRERGQSLLLLAWFREEQLLELQRLEAKVKQAQSLLDAALAEDAESLSAPKQGPKEGAELDPHLPLPAWKSILTALWPLLPPEAPALLVLDDAMAEAMAALPGIREEHAWVPTGYASARISRSSFFPGAKESLTGPEDVLFVYPVA